MCNSYLAQSPPSRSYNHGLQVNHKTHSIMASKFIFKLDRSWPPSTSPNMLDHSHQVHLHTHLVTSYTYICKWTRSPPASVSMSLLNRGRHLSASPNLLDHSIQVHLAVHSIGVSQCSSKCIQVLSAVWLSVCIYIDRLGWIIHAPLWCTKSCNWNKDEDDT